MVLLFTGGINFHYVNQILSLRPAKVAEPSAYL